MGLYMEIDKKKCVGCANCVPVCPMGAIYIKGDGLAEINKRRVWSATPAIAG